MEMIIIVMSGLVLLFVMLLIEETVNMRKLRIWIEEHFGKKPVRRTYNFERIGCYWKEFGGLVAEDEKLDEVTWNDLEMDKLFGRMNSCSSFVGEQVLYAKLHCLMKDNTKLELLEKRLNYHG